MNATQFKINHLRMTNIQKLLEGLLVLVGAIFVSALLPSLLFQYIYANQALTENPPVLEYMPTVVFGFSVLYLIYIVMGMMVRGKQIVKLETELALGFSADSTSAQDDKELKELEALVDEALASQEGGAKKTTRARRGRKAKK